MEIVMTAGAAGLIGALGPLVISRLPEPELDEGDTKTLYVQIARPRWLWLLLAIIGGTGGALVATEVGRTELLPVWALVCGVGAWLAYIDARTQLLPYLMTAPLYVAVWLLVGLAALIAGDHTIALNALIANVIVFAIFWVLHVIGRRFGGALGYGDVRFAAVLSVALGPLGTSATLVGLYAGFLLGAVGAIALSMLKLVDRRSFAFGPYLLAGAVIGVVFGQQFYGS